MKYKYANNQFYKNVLEVTDAELAEFKSQCETLDEENQKLYDAARQKNDSLIKELCELHSDNTLLLKYIKNNASIKRPHRNLDSYTRLFNSINTEKKKVAEAEKIKKAELESEALVQRAIIFLQNKGKVLGVDFDLKTALETANELRFEELTQEQIAHGGVDDFCGMNCDDCSGWDGIGHRCNCGNRRVYWTYDGNFENMYVYGEAY
jgi:hypothetical protein